MRKLAALPVLLSMLVLTSSIAQADDENYPSQVISVPSAPAALTNCRVKNRFTPYVNVVNRTTHELLTLTVQFKAYDADNTVIGSANLVWTPNPPLASGDSDLYGGQWEYLSLSEPETALARFTCRIIGATFSGRHEWQYGRSWAEKLLPLPSGGQSDGATTQYPESPATLAHPAGKGRVTVLKAWNDTARGVLIVHDQVEISADSSAVTVVPSQFLLSMKLADGSRRQFAALTHAAPKYEKYNYFLKQMEIANEVDPHEDLGALGFVAVPAKSTATVIVTFVISNAVADASDNTDVAMR